jgi:ubiquinone/menaquinone biosynthesis C-methylase UbiE
MAVNRVPERVVWAVKMLGVAPDDQLLEIGCGAGHAVSLICTQLDGGTITALDRSALMINLAQQRNQEHVAAGKARFQAVALEEAPFGDARFTKVFAFNVNVFERRPARALDVVRSVLLPSGGLHLFFQPPRADKTRGIAERVAAQLQLNRFVVSKIQTIDLPPAPLVSLLAHASG